MRRRRKLSGYETRKGVGSDSGALLFVRAANGVVESGHEDDKVSALPRGMFHMIAALVALAVGIAPLPQHASTPEAAAASFLDAFRRMDQAQFDEFFAPDVTMFFPDGPFPEGRVDGRDAVLSAFHNFFKLATERGRTSLNIAPVKQQVQHHGDLAVVTFELQGDNSVGRRSILLQRLGNEWRIIHFHASVIDK
jgi:ketosteroid isomerase-like protein